MKNVFVWMVALVTIAACNQPKVFRMNGSLPGAKDGTIVKLMNEDVYPYQLLDSAVVKGEKFIFQAKTPWEYPKFCSLVVDPNPGIVDQYKKNLKSYRFFADNTSITFECPLDSLPSYYWNPNNPRYQPVITGSPAQELYWQYKDQVKQFSEESGRLREKYLEVYHRPALDGVFNTEEGMKIVRERKRIEKSLNQITLQFIQEHKNSVVALKLAEGLLGRSVTAMTATEVNEVLNMLDPALQNAPLMDGVKKMADKALALAKGKKFTDVELIDLKGNKVRLADYVKPGMYNMLEVWASWCGPCRGEIPHLRHVYEVCGKENFNIVSISIDDKDADWKKAVAEEKMAWTQLCDPQGWQGGIVETYQVEGVPFSLVLDPEGKILTGGVRGAELDVILADYLGEKAKNL